MTLEKPNLHVSKNLDISKTKQDIGKLKDLSFKTRLEMLF